jgi:peptidoglycan/LPS O-acetylase OafA/YrhL
MRLEQLTFTRFIAAVSIVFFHYGQKLYPINSEGFKFIIGQANTGVSYFFILSGFVMMIAYQQNERIAVWAYYKNRFARIYPVYLIGLLCVWPMDHLLNNVPSLMTHVFLVQAFFPEWVLDYNLPAWSVSVELFFYALFPILFNLLYRKRHWWKGIGISVLLFWLISQGILHYLLNQITADKVPMYSESFVFYSPLLHLNEFLLGNISAMIFIRYYRTHSKDYTMALLGIVCLMIVALKFNTVFNFHNGLLAVFFVPFILALSLNTGKINTWLARPLLVYLGDISYRLYIYQYPIFHYCKGIQTGSTWLDFLIKFVLLIAVSALSYTYVETPLRKRIKD